MEKYWYHEDAIAYGIIKISVADIRAQSVFQSEMVNQTLLGTIVPILDKRDEFYLIQNWDSYWGWVNKHTLIIGDQTLAENWHQAKRVIFTANYGLVHTKPEENSDAITDLVPCSVIKKLEEGTKYTKVQLPDQQTGFVENALIADEMEQQKVKVSLQRIAEQAKKFLGVPYLWGGTSPKGFDCSGFVQIVFRLLNVNLPRDSGPMSRVGQNIPIEHGSQDFQTGDLLFFGKSIKRINHVAIYLGDDLYIHSRGKVGINSLNPRHPLYEDYLKGLFAKVQRVI
jgi:cell wall-associated NlpC family hydrolase